MYRCERIETHHHSSFGTASEKSLAEATYTSGECYVELFAAFPVRKSNARARAFSSRIQFARPARLRARTLRESCPADAGAHASSRAHRLLSRHEDIAGGLPRTALST